MIDLTSDQLAAIEDRTVHLRRFVYVEARDPDTGDPAPAGFWNDVGNVVVSVDGSDRTYYGSGTLIQVSDLQEVGDVTVPALQVTMSGLDPSVAAMIRGDTVGQVPMDFHVGLFDVDSHVLLPPLIRRFKGFVDDIEIKDPRSGGDGTVVLTCESVSRALTIRRTGTRSEGTQKERRAADGFYNYTGAQARRPIYFGRSNPVPTASGARRAGAA